MRPNSTRGASPAEPTSGSRHAVGYGGLLPLCCQAWIGETAHTWHRQHGREPQPTGRGGAPDRVTR